MDYTQLFRSLREAKNLGVEELADLGRLHRNTVVNIESGRPVKFKTIAALMQKMGYVASSAEMKSMALLWLEAISGIPFSRGEPESTARKAITTYRSSARQAAQELQDTVVASSLTPEQIRLLMFAAQHPAVLGVLENIRELATDLAASSGPPAPLLQAAEDADDSYGKK